MSDAPFMISPAGFIADVNFNGLPAFGGASGKSPMTVTQLLPGGLVSVVGNGSVGGSGGQVNLTGQIGGKQGSIQVDITTGGAGGTQGIAYLTTGGTNVYLGVILNSSNGPGIAVTDANGNNAFYSSAGTYASGVPLQVRVFWNSVSGSYQVFTNGVLTSSGTNAAWTSFVPTELVFGGAASSIGGLGFFAGAVKKVQVSNVGST